MKKIIIGLIVVSAFCGWSGTETIDGIKWQYYVSNGKAGLKWIEEPSLYTPDHPCIPTGTSGDIIIPTTFNNYPVVAIDERAFSGCYAITSIIIPNSVTNIGSGAFANCIKLESITIPDSVENIGSSAFSDCSKLESVTIPNSVTNIGAYAFDGCRALENIRILNGITSIGESAFRYCKPKCVTIPGQGHKIDVSGVTNVAISSGSTNISEMAFYNCRLLEHVSIPSSVISIGRRAFYDCTNLMSVTTTKGVQTIGSEAFYNCRMLSSLMLHEDVKKIGDYAFDGCSRLKNVTIPDGVSNIGSSVFSGCSSLENMALPNSVTNVGERAFNNCSSLLSVSMSDNVINIDSSAFSSCNSITDIEGLPQCVCTGKVSVVFPSYQSVTNIVVADGVTRIAADCFNGCLGLKKIVIPASVSVIYDNAFKDCVSLEEIVFLGDAPDVGSGIFTGTPRTMKITVKEGSIGWNGGVSTALPEVWPVGDATARGISYYDDSADIAALVPVITPEDGSIFADTCEVSISCAAEGAAIYYRTDGITPKIKDTYLYRGPFTISDTSKIVAVAVKEGFENAYATATLTKRTLTLAEAAGAADLTFTTGGDANWVPVGDKTAEGGVSARSGTIGDDGMSWLEVTVSGRGTLSFKQKASCEDDPLAADWDHLEVIVDGEEWYELRIDGETGWVDGQIEFTDNDTHTVCWVYAKDDCDSGGKDCAWVSGVTWVPADVTVDIGEGKSVVVPVEWIDSYTDIIAAAGGDKAAALQRTAANGRKVWECFMLGIDPTKADDDFRITRFWMENGEPKFEFSHSADGSGNSFIPRIKPLGKEKLTDSWQDVPPGGDPSFRFFTVEVELP